MKKLNVFKIAVSSSVCIHKRWRGQQKQGVGTGSLENAKGKDIDFQRSYSSTVDDAILFLSEQSTLLLALVTLITVCLL